MLHSLHNHACLMAVTAGATVTVVALARRLPVDLRPGSLSQYLLALALVKGTLHMAMPEHHTRSHMADVYIGAMRTATDCFVIFLLVFLFENVL